MNVCSRRPSPVKIGACQALSQLLPEANKENIQPQLMGLFSSLTDLLHQVMLQEDSSILSLNVHLLVLLNSLPRRHLMKHYTWCLKHCKHLLRQVGVDIIVNHSEAFPVSCLSAISASVVVKLQFVKQQYHSSLLSHL